MIRERASERVYLLSVIIVVVVVIAVVALDTIITYLYISPGELTLISEPSRRSPTRPRFTQSRTIEHCGSGDPSAMTDKGKPEHSACLHVPAFFFLVHPLVPLSIVVVATPATAAAAA